MTFKFINNNIYYKNFKIFNFELSLLLVPILIIIILYFKKYINYFSNIFLAIFICGIIDSYVKSLIYSLPAILYANIIFHSFGLYPLVDFKKYFKPNLINYLLGILAILVIIFLPYWPYDVNRFIFIISIILIYISTTTIYFFLFKV